MWNNIRTIWRLLSGLFFIVTTLILIYFVHSIGGFDRFRFVFWQATPPIVNEDASKQPAQTKPGDDNPLDSEGSEENEQGH